jgi:hypothetical protein
MVPSKSHEVTGLQKKLPGGGTRRATSLGISKLEQGIVVIEPLYQSFAVDKKRGRSARARSTR